MLTSLLCIDLALLFQNYWCRITATLYKPDTSLRWTVEVGPYGVCLRREFTVITEINSNTIAMRLNARRTKKWEL